MKIPTMLLHRVLLDVRLQVSDTVDRDYREICSRYEREGMSFLTITLPTLDDALLKGLSRGRLLRSDYVGFRSHRRNGSLPALLSGFFRRIFHDDGLIMDVPDVCAIQAIRQVARLFKKVELPCSKPRVKAAFERYRSNDQEVDWRCHKQPFNTSLFRSITGFLWSDLELLSGKLYCFPGQFGNGATAERLNRNERYTITEWPERAEGSFPSSFFASHREDFGPTSGITYLSPEKERPVRVVQVPKTLKTPRTISVEPSYMMLMQQSIAKPLMVYLESKRFGFQSIRFVDQSINNALARLGSVDGSLATIDLKDASDLVDNDLVREIFEGPAPTFLNLIQDCRSTTAKMPCGTIVPLKKFASMGSALCFPIESMVFFTIIMYALVKNTGRVPSRRLLQQLAKDVAVYGDDIVVPSSMAPVVMDSLEDFGLKVNRDKSFHTGLFRESCGGDYYKGVDVTPAYVRHWDDTGTLSKASHKVAYVALSNTFYMKGLWHACQYLRDGLDRVFKHRIPLARHPIGVLHYSSFIRDTNVSWNSALSGYRVKGYRVRSPKESDSPGDISGFLGLAFGSRMFRETIHEFKSTVCREGRLEHFSAYERELVRESTASAVDARFVCSQLKRYVPTPLQAGTPDERSTVPCERYLSYSTSASGDFRLISSGMSREAVPEFQGSLLPCSSKQLRRDRFRHLTVDGGKSLYTSDRPHALCLKRGWTVSQAGLNW